MITRSFKVPANWLWIGLAGLVILPFAELTAFFWVASRIGLPLALIVLVATSFIGVSLLRHQGSAAFMRLMRSFSGGQPPQGAARESLMVALGGALMIVPGFITDIIGFVLILPSLVRQWQENPSVTPHSRPRSRADNKVIDLDRGEWKPVDE